MKKIYSAILALVMVFAVSACGAKITTRTFEGNLNNIKSKIVLTAKGDKVTKQVQTSTVTFTQINATTPEQKKMVEEQVKKASEKFKNIKGVKESYTVDANGINETIEINLEEADLKDLKAKGIYDVEGDVSKGISLKKTADKLIGLGMKELK